MTCQCPKHEELLTVDEVADILSLSPNTVRRLIGTLDPTDEQPALASVKICGRRRIVRSDLDNFIRALPRASPDL